MSQDIIVLSERIKELSHSTGTGDFTLDGAATGFSAFGDSYASGDALYYAITDGTDYEVGSGVYTNDTATSRLVRFPLRSTNSDAAVTFTAGLKEVYVTYPGQFSVFSASGLGSFSQPQASGLAFWGSSNIVDYDSDIVWDKDNSRIGVSEDSPQYAIHIGGSETYSQINASGFIVGDSGIMFSGVDPAYSGGRQLEPFLRNELDSTTGTDAVFALSGLVDHIILFEKQTAGTVLAGPPSGCTPSSTCPENYPVFRALVADDIPDLSNYYLIQKDDAYYPGMSSGIAFFHESGVIDTDSELVWDKSNDRLGVNKTNPTATLDVDGDAKISGQLLVGGDVTVTGNLDVQGDVTYVDSSTVTIWDKNLELASLSGNAQGGDSTIDDAGLIIKSTDTDKKWTWRDYTDAWTTDQKIDVSGIIFNDGSTISGAYQAGSGLSLHNGLEFNVGNMFTISSDDAVVHNIHQSDRISFSGIEGVTTSITLSSSSCSWSQLGNQIVGAVDNDRLGDSCSLNNDGTVVAVGAASANTGDGEARVYDLVGGTWTQRGSTFTGESGDVGYLGDDVSLNGSGNVLAIGIPGANPNNSGEVQVYDWNGSSWSQRGSDILSDGSQSDFGNTLALNDSGNILAVGAPFYSGGSNASGQVRVFEWNGSSWAQKGSSLYGDSTNDDYYGYDVDINASGGVLAVGAREANSASGYVKVYEWSGSDWSQKGSTFNGASVERNGTSVSLNASGDVVAIGAPGSGTNTGRVHVYEWGGASWSQKGSDLQGGSTSDQFGHTIDLNDAGNKIVISNIGNDDGGNAAGQIQTYKFTDGEWEQTGSDINGAEASDQFGWSIAINSEGDKIAAGQQQTGSSHHKRGYVNVYSEACIEGEDKVMKISAASVSHDIDASGAALVDKIDASGAALASKIDASGAALETSIGSVSGYSEAYTDAAIINSNAYTHWTIHDGVGNNENITTTVDVYVSGISGIDTYYNSSSNVLEINANAISGWADSTITAGDNTVSGWIDASGAALANKIDASGTALVNKIDASGAALSADIDASGAALVNKIDASGAALETSIGSVSGWANSTFLSGVSPEFTHISGVAYYASGQVETISSSTAGSGLVKVSNVFHTAGTGNFDAVQVGIGNNDLVKVGFGNVDEAHSERSVLIGQRAGSGMLRMQNSVLVGYLAGALSSGDIAAHSGNNIFIGTTAGYASSGSEYSNFIGRHAGRNANETTYSNALGRDCLKSSNNVAHNNAIGYAAGRDLSYSYYSDFVGYGAGELAAGVSGSVVIGRLAGWSLANANHSVYIGEKAGYDADSGDTSVCIGYFAGSNINGDNNIYLGYYAGGNSAGSNNIEIVTDGQTPTTILASNSNKIHIENTIIGDTSVKKIAVGGISASNLTPNATVEVLPALSTDVGVIVQGAAAQSADLQQWQDSSEVVKAKIDVDGKLETSGNILTSGALVARSNLYVGTDSAPSGTPTASVSGQFMRWSREGGTSGGTVQYISGIRLFASQPHEHALSGMIEFRVDADTNGISQSTSSPVYTYAKGFSFALNSSKSAMAISSMADSLGKSNSVPQVTFNGGDSSVVASGHGGVNIKSIHTNAPHLVIYAKGDASTTYENLTEWRGGYNDSPESIHSFVDASGHFDVRGMTSKNYKLHGDGYITDTTTSRTLSDSDNGQVLMFNNSSAITVTVPAGLTLGFACTTLQLGAGQITFSASSTTINNRSGHTKTAGQHAKVELRHYASDTYNLSGDTGT